MFFNMEELIKKSEEKTVYNNVELAIKEMSFTRVPHSLKPGGVYAVPEGSYNLAGVWVSQREMYFSVDHSEQLLLRAGW